jgi:hypothetical protein
MRRILWLGVVGALALTAAGVAVAKRAADAEKVSATFSAVATDNVRTHTCGTTQRVAGLFTGEAESSDARLDGPITLRVTSVYDTEDNVGVVQGRVRFSRDDEEGKGGARLHAVNDNGTLHGVVIGGVRQQRAHLVATFTADFAAAGFTNGKLGTGSAGDNTGAVWAGKKCAEEGATTAARGKRQGSREGKREGSRTAGGEVTEITETSITVKTEDGQVSCTLTAEQAAHLSDRVKAGDKVDLSCNAEGKLLKIRLKE